MRGSTVGIVFPSAAMSVRARHRLDRAVAFLRGLEFEVKLGSRIEEDKRPASATIQARVYDLHEMFVDPSVRCILTGIGGNTSNQLLRHLDFPLIRANPTVFMGYSDITVLHYAFATQANLASFYGPCAATQFGEFPRIFPYTEEWFISQINPTGEARSLVPSDMWTDEFLDWFQRLDETRARRMVKNPGWHWLRRGDAEGWVLAGCLGSLNRLAGTHYWIEPAGSVLFLDILGTGGGDVLSRADADLTDLDNLGVFDDIVGLAVGRLSGFGVKAAQRVIQRIGELTSRQGYPVVVGIDLGHTDPMATLRYGQEVRISQSGAITLMA